jgi:organic radical activating enzyme
MLLNCDDIKINSSDDVIFVGSLEYYLTDLLCLTWEMLSSCNYNCSYCYCNHQPEAKHDYSKFIKFLKDCKADKLELIFTGGEPSIFKDFLKIIKDIPAILSDNFNSSVVKMMTNFSGSIDYYKDFIEVFKDSKIIISPSYHYIQDRRVYNFLEKAITLHHTHPDLFLDIRILLDPLYFRSIVEDYNILKSYLPISDSLRLTPKLLVSADYIDSSIISWHDTEIREIVNSHKFYKTINMSIIYYDENKEIKHGIIDRELFMKMYHNGLVINWICSTCKNNINIFNDGFIGYCQATSEKTIPFNIYQDSLFKRETKDILCSRDICGCGYITPKINMNNYTVFKNIPIEWLRQEYGRYNSFL